MSVWNSNAITARIQAQKKICLWNHNAITRTQAKKILRMKSQCHHCKNPGKPKKKTIHSVYCKHARPHFFAPAVLLFSSTPELFFLGLTTQFILLNLARPDARLHLHLQVRVHLFLWTNQLPSYTDINVGERGMGAFHTHNKSSSKNMKTYNASLS